VPFDNAALAYLSMGQYDKALTSTAAALQVDPKDSFAPQNMAAAYFRLGRYDEAKAVVEKAKAQGLFQPIGDVVLIQIACVRGDPPTMEKLVAAYAGNGMEPIMVGIMGVNEYGHGKRKASQPLFARAIQLAQQYGEKEFAAQMYAQQAGYDAEVMFDLG